MFEIHVQLDGHRFRLAVTATSTTAPRGTGRSPSRSIHCVRAVRPRWKACWALFGQLRRMHGRRSGRRRLSGLDVQLGQPLLLFGEVLCPDNWLLLLLKPLAQVVAVHEHAGGDLGEAAVGVDEVGGGSGVIS
ncbi:hypothetical protein ACIGO8_33520 [Streptomyces sp. NPDC053493]|uniref:hypothetical protein n=1 Tax=Streptomyces sp. NPDC053493 TaxID=3365705 RepID=UPI0037D30137